MSTGIILKVHILEHGRVLCDFAAGLPGTWPEGHKWVGRDAARDATCVECKRVDGTLPPIKCNGH